MDSATCIPRIVHPRDRKLWAVFDEVVSPSISVEFTTRLERQVCSDLTLVSEPALQDYNSTDSITFSVLATSMNKLPVESTRLYLIMDSTQRYSTYPATRVITTNITGSSFVTDSDGLANITFIVSHTPQKNVA